MQTSNMMPSQCCWTTTPVFLYFWLELKEIVVHSTWRASSWLSLVVGIHGKWILFFSFSNSFPLKKCMPNQQYLTHLGCIIAMDFVDMLQRSYILESYTYTVIISHYIATVFVFISLGPHPPQICSSHISSKLCAHLLTIEWDIPTMVINGLFWIAGSL